MREDEKARLIGMNVYMYSCALRIYSKNLFIDVYLIIIRQLRRDCQHVLFSATYNEEVMTFAKKSMLQGISFI